MFSTLVCAAPSFAQNRYEWTVYSALNTVQSVSFDSDGMVWAATTGGVVGYHPETDSFEVVRTTEGLMTLNTSCVAVDPTTGSIYAGANDGTLSIRSPDGVWRGIADIAGIDIADRRILDFNFHGGLVYVLTAFGVAVYDPVDSNFPETWTRFRDFPQNTAVNDILFWRDSVYLATDRGIAIAPERGSLLPNPLSWRVIDRRNGLAGDRVLSLTVIANELVIGSDSGTFTRNDSGVFRRRDDIPYHEPIRITDNGAHTIASTTFALFRLNGTQFQRVEVPMQTFVKTIAVSSTGKIAYAAGNIGIGYVDGDSSRIIVPSAPAANYFSDIALDANGAIWTSHSDWGGGGSRLSMLRDNKWTHVVTPTTGQGPMNVGLGGDSAIWAGTWGSGMMRVAQSDTGMSVTRYDNANAPLTSADAGNASYVVAGDAVADAHGRTWFINWDSRGQTNPMLVVRLSPEEIAVEGREFISFIRPPSVAVRAFRSIVIDQSGTKWMGYDETGSAGISRQGLVGFSDNGTIASESDDKWRTLKTTHGLVSDQQTALAIDLDGALWAGAPTGLSVVDNPMTVKSEGEKEARIRNSDPNGNCCRALRDVNVSAIAVDALNRKWIGTNQGVFVLSPDGIDVVDRFTVDNSPLVDNDVKSLLAVDETGDVYIGTSNGLNRVSTEAVESPEPVGGLTVWPQPFVVSVDESVRIGGLPPNARVKILTVNGRLVAEFDSPGGSIAFWNGLDDTSKPVASGVYLIAAGAASGEITVVGKIAVVRR